MLEVVDRALEQAADASPAELSRGGASERSGRRGEEMLVSEEAIGEARCPSSTLLPGQPRKPARAGRGGGDSGSNSPGHQRAGSGEGVGGTAPHHSCRYGPSFPLPPPFHRPGLGHPQILSPLWHRHRDRDRVSRHHRCRSLAGEGARPPGPPAPLRCGRQRGGRRREEGVGRGLDGGEMGLGGPSGDRVAGERGLSGRMGAARAGDELRGGELA